MKLKNQWGAASWLDTCLKANAELMKYVYPTRKAVEHTGADGEKLQMTFTQIVGILDDSDE